MTSIRKAGWFLVLALLLAGWMGALGSLQGVAEAGVIASRGTGAGDLRAADAARVQAFLERKVVLQKLVDYGVSPEEAMAKMRSMSDSDLHRLASLTDRVAAGADDGLGLLIGAAILIILIIVIFKLMNKEIVVR
ncbi:MAG: PA2779 family protein [Deltaproteobacteria bacterium]|nr:PA2779 family protein [Deltaproteobacteria bacterium]